MKYVPPSHIPEIKCKGDCPIMACFSCDYEEYIKTVSEEDIDNFNFTEAWEWEARKYA